MVAPQLNEAGWRDALAILDEAVEGARRRHQMPPPHAIGRLPRIEGGKTAKTEFRTYPIGLFHIDLVEVQTAEGKLHMVTAIDRMSEFAFIELHRKAERARDR